MIADERERFERALRHARIAACEPGEYVGQESFMRASDIRAVAAAAGIGPGVDVLDACCGVGGPGGLIVREFGCAYLGVDANPAAVAVARARTAGLPCHFAEARIPPLPPRSFDVVLLLETMLAFPDKRAIFQAVAEALRPGGRFAFTLEAGAPLTTAERAAMPRADTVWPAELADVVAAAEEVGLVTTWQQDQTAAHHATAVALAEAFAADADAIVPVIGRRALEDLLAAHHVWISWLGSGRVRKVAVVAAAG